jgi:hypothetical protein
MSERASDQGERRCVRVDRLELVCENDGPPPRDAAGIDGSPGRESIDRSGSSGPMDANVRSVALIAGSMTRVGSREAAHA